MNLEKIKQCITFKIKGYTTFTINIHSEGDYFSTTATGRGRFGQCQNYVLDGLALAFYNRYDKYHCKSIKNISEKEVQAILDDIEILKQNYNYRIKGKEISWGTWHYSDSVNIPIKKEGAFDIGEYQKRSDLTLKEILEKINLFQQLDDELNINQNALPKRMKI